MNILAHFDLSEQNEKLLLGSFLGDFIKGNIEMVIDENIQKGVYIHRKIDRFSDEHPAFIRSKNRFQKPFRRFSGILVDIIYDHFLALDWTLFHTKPLSEYAKKVCHVLETFWAELPPDGKRFFTYMKKNNLPENYRSLKTIEMVLQDIGNYRLKRKISLEYSMEFFRKNYKDFHNDFLEFFPEAIHFSEKIHKFYKV